MCCLPLKTSMDGGLRHTSVPGSAVTVKDMSEKQGSNSGCYKVVSGEG